jgi:hypothetical protein
MFGSRRAMGECPDPAFVYRFLALAGVRTGFSRDFIGVVVALASMARHHQWESFGNRRRPVPRIQGLAESTAMNPSVHLDDSTSDRARGWDAVDRRDWIIVGVVCSIIIGVVDESLVSAGIWLAASLFRAYRGIPAIFQMARRLSERRRSFLLDVMLGWALIPGPHVGSLFGTLSPVIFGLPISSFSGGLLGLVIGPIVAAIQGVVLVTVFEFLLRISTGKSLFIDEQG